MGLGEAEQHCTLSVHMYSSSYFPFPLPGASQATIEVLLTLYAVFIELLAQLKNIPNPNQLKCLLTLNIKGEAGYVETTAIW